MDLEESVGGMNVDDAPSENPNGVSRVKTYFRIFPGKLSDASRRGSEERVILRKVERSNETTVEMYKDQRSFASPGANDGKKEKFSFDHVFDENAKQKDVYDIIGNQVMDNFEKKYNTVVLSYGQTGSGKTYTMLGPEGGLGLKGDEREISESHGLIPRIVDEMFKRASEETINKRKEIEYSFELSCYEVVPIEDRDSARVRDLLHSAIRVLDVSEKMKDETIKQEVRRALGELTPKEVLVVEKRSKLKHQVHSFQPEKKRSVVITFEDRQAAISLQESNNKKLSELHQKLRKIRGDRDFNVISEGYSCKITDDKSSKILGNFLVEGLSRVKINSFPEAMSVIADAMKLRQVSSTNFSEYSSRSHMLTTISSVCRTGTGGAFRQDVNVTIVDLAGTELAQGRDSKFINTSLSHLSTAVRSLAEKGKGNPPSWRSSKLLMLLKGCMTGMSKTILIATAYGKVSGDVSAHTWSTLNFAKSCKQIKIQAEQVRLVYDERAGKKAQESIEDQVKEENGKIKELEEEVKKLKSASEEEKKKAENELQKANERMQALEKEKRKLELERKKVMNESNQRMEKRMQEMTERRLNERKAWVDDILQQNLHENSEESKRLLDTIDLHGFKAYAEENMNRVVVLTDDIRKVLDDKKLSEDERQKKSEQKVSVCVQSLQAMLRSTLAIARELDRKVNELNTEKEELETELHLVRNQSALFENQRTRLLNKLKSNSG